ncbi:OmpA family protein [Alcaligenes endophyticus]|uniref:OmpA family protein n=1 Tax=Alcaligenes endophyticus TaxID=1929088 RepID=A0ABT8ELV5_9BURK|nr:OmpA family protein [Alcaligenes endophyticus]MCX5591154.1 OmpA family protein [Alcaligenes endophyticus]MDN4122268.1 OmpA family protein [Alcaligenes endophyticus]
MSISIRTAKFGVCLGMTALMAACVTTQSTGGRTAIGAGAGAAAGAGLGAIIGDSSKAALIGAGIGALAGGIAGYNWSGIKQDVQQSGASNLGVDVTEMPDGSLRVNIPSHVSFDTGKYQLKSALLPVLDSVARALIQHPELRAVAVGYTDSTGSLQTNQVLSRERAQAVTTYLSHQGVGGNRLIAEGRADSQPIGNNATAEGRALNRRVELYLYAPQQ